MHVLAVNGSMRRGKNTDALVRAALDALCGAIPGTSTEVVCTADLRLSPCRVVCSNICSSPPFRCSIQDDVPAVLTRMREADAVILAAPQYFRAPPSAFHTLMERLTSMSFFQESRGCCAPHPLSGKPCGLIAVAEYSNPQFILEYLRDASLLLKMRPVTIPGFPYLGAGGHGDVASDVVFLPLERARELGLELGRVIARQ